MRPRAGKEVVLSRMNSIMLHDWKTVMSSPILNKGGVAKHADMPTTEKAAGDGATEEISVFKE